MVEEWLRQLIEFRTVSGKKEEMRRLYEWVLKRVEGYGLKVERVEKEGVESLILATKSLKRPKVLLQAHVDVVPAGEVMFHPRVEEGRLYGRGANDMKHAVAVYLSLLEKWHRKGVLGGMNVGVMLTSDEEVGGFKGVGYLVERGYGGEVVFLPDGGDNWGVVLEEKGVYHFKLKAKGKAAHGSRVWQGENAGDKLIRVYERLRRNFECSDPENHWHHTLNLGKMEGGDATNKVMEEAVFYLDLRHTAAVRKEEIEKMIREAIGDEGGVEVEESVYGSPLFVDKENKYVRLWTQVLEQRGIKWHYHRGHGASDGRFFSAKGMPVVMSKMACGGLHTEEEWVDLESLREFEECLDRWVKQAHLNFV